MFERGIGREFARALVKSGGHLTGVTRRSLAVFLHYRVVRASFPVNFARHLWMQ